MGDCIWSKETVFYGEYPDFGATIELLLVPLPIASVELTIDLDNGTVVELKKTLDPDVPIPLLAELSWSMILNDDGPGIWKLPVFGWKPALLWSPELWYRLNLGVYCRGGEFI